MGMLETDDHEITIVFESQLTIGSTKPAIMRFGFEMARSSRRSGNGCMLRKYPHDACL